jgi:hypothetical protein
MSKSAHVLKYIELKSGYNDNGHPDPQSRSAAGTPNRARSALRVVSEKLGDAD